MTNTVTIASIETEQLVLGSMLSNRKDCRIVCNALNEEYFCDSKHRLIFAAIKQFADTGKPLETHLLAKHLEQVGDANSFGGIQYLVTLAQMVGSGIYVEEYIQLLKDIWAKRVAVDEINKFQTALDKTSSVRELLDSHAKKLRSISKESFSSSALSFFQISRGIGSVGYLKSRKSRLDYFRKHNTPFVDGVSTGYRDLDKVIGGFCNSNFIVLAGRPGMGKTAIALNFVRRIAEQVPVGFISLEMTSEQLYERMISMETNIPGDLIREGRLSDDQWNTIEAKESHVAQLPIHLHEGSHFLGDLIAKIQNLKDEQGIQFLVIDYLQLVNASGDTRFLEIANITRDLKNLSVELHLPILCLAQLSRKVEDRPGHRPMLSDLRENGCIEQDADAVMFIVRQDYYEANTRPGEADLIIAKNRHGKTGEITLHFDKDAARFENLEKSGDGGGLF